MVEVVILGECILECACVCDSGQMSRQFAERCKLNAMDAGFTLFVPAAVEAGVLKPRGGDEGESRVDRNT